MVQFKNNWLYIFSEYQIETLEGDPTAWWSVDGGAASALKLCVSQTMGRFCILCVLQVFLHKKKEKKGSMILGVYKFETFIMYTL